MWQVRARGAGEAKGTERGQRTDLAGRLHEPKHALSLDACLSPGVHSLICLPLLPMSDSEEPTVENVTPEGYAALGKVLCDEATPMAKRIRTVFTLRCLATNEAVDALVPALTDKSALLGHEVAYCLGQTKNTHAIPALVRTLENAELHPMVRHEAAEALGAIGDPSAVGVLNKYKDDPLPEIRDTCEIALHLIDWKEKNRDQPNANTSGGYMSVDPAPALLDKDLNVPKLRAKLMDRSRTIFERYRALFALRNIGTTEAVEAMSDALHDVESGPVFTHEIAYVMGQLQHPAAVQTLQRALKNPALNPMVRHEAAEALGSIADLETVRMLEEFSKDPVEPVKESCIVALDILAYENSNEFQYADGIETVTSS